MGLVSANRRGRPILAGYVGSNSGNPTPVARIAGDISVAMGMISSSTTLPTCADHTLWGAGASGNGCALAVLTEAIVAAKTSALSFTGAANTRSSWVFRNAKLGQIEYFTAATGTALAIPALTNVKPGSFLGCVFMSRASQADITLYAPPGFGQRTLSSGTAPSRWAGDTGNDLQSAFAGHNATFGAATSGSCGVVFSIEPLD